MQNGCLTGLCSGGVGSPVRPSLRAGQLSDSKLREESGVRDVPGGGSTFGSWSAKLGPDRCQQVRREIGVEYTYRMLRNNTAVLKGKQNKKHKLHPPDPAQTPGF